jgi:hypothetical protein
MGQKIEVVNRGLCTAGGNLKTTERAEYTVAINGAVICQNLDPQGNYCNVQCEKICQIATQANKALSETNR